MYCPNCETEVTSVVQLVSETYPVKGEDIEITARVRICSRCKEEIWDEELDSENLMKAFDEYRRKHGLMFPDDIRATREKYGLSQTAFARVLGFGDKTITRYENGSIPDAAQNNLIELVQSPSNFKKLLDKNKDKITLSDYSVACKRMEQLQPKIICSYSTSEESYRFRTHTKYTVPIGGRMWGDYYA